MSRPLPHRTVALALRLLGAAASLTALLALLGGIPWVLVSAGTLPHGVPSGADIADTLTSSEGGGQVLFTLLTLLAWCGWSWFMLGLLAEIPRHLRRRPTRRHRRLGAPQRLAGFLLGGLLLLPAGTAVAAPASTVAATAPQQPAPDHSPPAPALASAGSAVSTSPPAAAKGPVHIVGATGETVWDLAEKYLGSGPRAQEIRRLNPGLPQSPLLPPGLEIQLPADAHTPASPPPAAHQQDHNAIQLTAEERPLSRPSQPRRASGTQRTHTVRPGETLSSIAGQETGDASTWPRLYEANRDHPQPDGAPRLKDPDLIYPGQKILIPARSDTLPGAAPEDDTNEQPGQADKHSDKGEAHDDTGKPSARPGQREQQPSSPATPDQDPAAPTPTPSAPAPAPEHEPGSSSPLITPARTAGVLASLAAAVTLALTIRRILQRRRANPGQRIAMPPEPSPTEAQLAQAAQAPQAHGIHRLDLALRALAAQASHDETAVPDIRGARITSSAVQILPADPTAEPVTPFTQGPSPWWTLDHDTDLPADAAQNDAPHPGLATIGSDAAGNLMLLNLPHSGVVLLDGERGPREEILTSLALELAMSPWASGVEVVVAGFGDGLNTLLPTARIAHMATGAQAARDFAERLLEAHQEHETGLRRTPYLILCAAELDADSAWSIAETLSHTTDLMKVAVIAPTPHTTLLFDESERLSANDRQPQHIYALETDVTLQRLTRQAYQDITTALATSGEEPHPAEGPWRHVPTEPHARAAAPAPAPGPGPGPDADRAAAGSRTVQRNDPDGSPPPAPLVKRSFTPPEASDPDTGGLGVFPALLAASADPAAVPQPFSPAGPRTTPTAEHKNMGKGQAHRAEAVQHEPSAVPSRATHHGAATEASSPTALSTAAAPSTPRIQVLGPVTISGVAASKHGTREAQLAALLHLRPGRDADALCADMDPSSPWSPETLNARLGGLRRSLGNDPDGNPYVPRRAVKSDPFRLSDKICCDWHAFHKTAEQELPRGAPGLPLLEEALDQVRGRPFGAQTLPWSEPLQQEMAMRIVAVAHTVATHRLHKGPHHDLTLARRAISTGLEADEYSELLFRDWFRIEYAAGNRAGLNTAIARLEQVNRFLGLPTELETEELLRDLLTHPSATKLL
ncbi:LysM domain/BON superfamily protein (plasmid) [Streptomyces sp. YIM 121038]|uniref:LysM peptidoglycan-binding domain-containing protein n=1 Tax=Streptomyces sp. YIM 121038 TaxID=2136401 RepID=UPI00111007B4|nr:LysM peptidoglycan-binding domain-containing protein [Streptomyces sp. YIM 121038]QCX82281.1 LysM domain/BON superfamily protein [Streptomyces sp. YIM 121038]